MNGGSVLIGAKLHFGGTKDLLCSVNIQVKNSYLRGIQRHCPQVPPADTCLMGAATYFFRPPTAGTQRLSST